MAKKVNPRNRPATQADVDRAREWGQSFGVEFALNVVLYVLKDKHDARDEDIRQFRDEFMYVIDSVGRKYLTYSDIVRTLKTEYDLSIRLTDKGGGARE